jgi:starch synthase
MKILMVSAEVVPFAKTGGLADAVAALAGALSNLGHDVRIVIPRYYRIDRKSLAPLDGPMGVPVGTGEEWTGVYKATLPGYPKVIVYFIDHELCYGRDGIYGTKAEPDFHDNPYRFSLLAHGAFQLCNKLQWFPDIMHAHDWSACLVPVLLKHVYRYQKPFARTASVLTIHNMGYQGLYRKDQFADLAIDWSLYYGAGFERNGDINFLQAGITCADMITTVSPTYAKEIQTPEGGFGLDGLLRVRSDVVRGILNGVDVSCWNPQADPLIPASYDMHNLSGKSLCKTALQKEFGLPENSEIPIVGLVSRLVSQKGIEEVFAPLYGCLYRLCTTMKIQLIVLGNGEKWCEDEIKSLESKLPNMRAYIGYSERLSHLVESGADFFLMPSRYEPCGLNQMYSLIYGTLPIVRRTGGLADTVQNYDEKTGDGTGFMFDLLTPQSVYDTVGWAVYAYFNKREHIEKMKKRAMGHDFSWNASCLNYRTVYEEALKRGCSSD